MGRFLVNKKKKYFTVCKTVCKCINTSEEQKTTHDNSMKMSIWENCNENQGIQKNHGLNFTEKGKKIKRLK